MKHRAAAIIIENDKILLIHRIKTGREYYVLPGGTIEHGETPEIACKREVKEETGLDVRIGKRMYTFAKQGRKEYSFIATPTGGTIQVGETEHLRTKPDNQYILEWINTAMFKDITFSPETLQDIIIKQLITR